MAGGSEVCAAWRVVMGMALLSLALAVGCGSVKKGADDIDGGADDDSDDDGSDTTPPTVTETAPVATAASVAEDIAVTASFSEAMDAASLTAETFLVRAAEGEIEGQVTFEGTTATFTPSSPLPGGTPLTATITTGATDEAGNPLAEPQEWKFTTVTTTCVRPGSPGCHPTIVAAITASAAGDSIAVAAGQYNGNLVIDKTLTLLGGYSDDFERRDPDTLVSEIRPSDPLVQVIAINGVFDSTPAVAPIVEGFTVSGGRNMNEHGGAFRIVNSDAKLRYNLVVDNHGYFLGGGIYVQNGAPLLLGNRILNNRVTADNGSGGGVMLEDTTATLIDNLVAENDAPFDVVSGGGIQISGGGPVTLTGNRIEGNSAGGMGFTALGGGIGIGNAEVHIRGGTIVDNEVFQTGSGGGLNAIGSVVTIEGVRIENNAAGPMGGTGSGIATGTTGLRLSSAVVAGNRNGEAGIYIGATSPSSIINCTISGHPGQGIRTESPLTLGNTIVVGELVGLNVAAAVPVIALDNDFFGNTTNATGITLDDSNLLVDPMLDETLHLTASSPLLDVGSAEAFVQAGGAATIALPTVDIDGEPRAMIGPSDSARPDIGADERAPR